MTDSFAKPFRMPGDAAMAAAPARAAGSVERPVNVIASRQILRFHKSERVLHWAIAVPFILCYATGMVLWIFYTVRSPHISRVALAWAHRIGGASLILFPLLTALRNTDDYKVHLENIKQAWTWALDDIKWLFLMGAAAINSKIKLPDQGKFNAAEKINFMMVMCTYPIFILTGVLLWLPMFKFLAWMVHVAFALVATPLMLGHIYMALVNPSTRVGLSGMTTGYVDREWADHHYHKWYAENFGPGLAKTDHDHLHALPVFVRCTSCDKDHAVATWSHLVEKVLAAKALICPGCGSDSRSLAVVAEPVQMDWIRRGFEQAGVACVVSAE